MSKEAMKLALEALEWAEFLVESDERSCQDAKNSVDKAITALREALAQQEPVATLHDDGYWTPKKTEAGRKFNETMNKVGSRVDVCTSPPAQRKPLTDEYDYLLGALRTIAEGTYDAWSNGAQAQRTAMAAIEKYKAAHGIKENT